MYSSGQSEIEKNKRSVVHLKRKGEDLLDIFYEPLPGIWNEECANWKWNEVRKTYVFLYLLNELVG